MRIPQLRDQTVVITGASSGIGLVTARLAARRGARVVLNARNEAALKSIVDEIVAAGGKALYVVGDVGRIDDVRRIADASIRRFGGFDTWVNNAGVSIYGCVLDQPLEDQRQLFETNYWGVVNGSLVACEHFRKRGGVLINVGSVLSDRAIPLQGTYCASKHAVKGFTDALRMELEKEGSPIAVALVKPSTIDTPYIQHAKNLTDTEPLNPPPVYSPDTVAQAILRCAKQPEREVFVGAGIALSELAHHAPQLTDKLLEATMFDLQKSSEPKNQTRSDSLYAAGDDGRERGHYPGHVSESSVVTGMSLHPIITGIVLAGISLALAGLLTTRLRSSN